MKKSVVTKYMHISVFSGEPAECTHHLISGSGYRKLADKDGLTIPLTHEEHNIAAHPEDRIHGNPRAEDLSKIAGQLAYEKEFYRKQLCGKDDDPAREEFRSRYGKSYL